MLMPFTKSNPFKTRLNLFKPAKNKILKLILGTFLLLVTCYFIESRFDLNTQKYLPGFAGNKEIDSLEFAPNHPQVSLSALAQLNDFPAPQFKSGHQLLPNFLWMDPSYLGGLLQPKYKIKECVSLSTKIQAELSSNWNYYFIVNTNLKAYKNYRDTNTFAGAWVKYVNAHSNLPAAAISFWAQLQPNKTASGCSASLAYVYNNQQPDCCYVHDKNGALISRKYASPLTPVEALTCDFKTQSIYVDSLLSALKRPLQMINENGEVFKLYEDDFLEQDARIVAEKKKFESLSWNEFQAMKRFEKELAYKNSFMLKPALKNCIYSEYAIDGQNKYRHDYKTIRKINSKINDQYYATPDFYPRYPNNWKDWQGPWHGLKWLEISRKTELALNDNLFSPFVAAGWDSVEANNIRPAQWLGLLKVIGTLGAEYYYGGFFNTGKAVAKPENYIWQAVMPVYAQAVTSFYEDVLRKGKIVENDGLIQYPFNDVPVVIRKSNQSKRWIIACSWQTGTNFNKNTQIAKEIMVDLGHKKIKVMARRHGSVYVYSEEGLTPVFYQLDGWHEYMHPYFWSKNVVLEAELYDNNISTESIAINDYSTFTSSANISSELTLPFEFHGNAKNVKQVIVWIPQNDQVKEIKLLLDNVAIGEIMLKKQGKLTPYKLQIKTGAIKLNQGKHSLTLRVSSPGIKIDKIEIINE